VFGHFSVHADAQEWRVAGPGQIEIENTSADADGFGLRLCKWRAARQKSAYDRISNYPSRAISVNLLIAVSTGDCTSFNMHSAETFQIYVLHHLKQID
jgi:hypothetical protein